MEYLTAFQLQPDRAGFDLVPAGHGRVWMDGTWGRSAYRCLPMLIANQSGWVVSCPWDVRFRWDPEVVGLDAITVEYGGGVRPGPGEPQVLSHFGSGVVSWTLPYLFRTPPGFDLLVRGPANWPRDGVSALEGVVEADHAVESFTMNWMVTRPGVWVEFGLGEPFCMLVPVRRGELEECVPEIVPIVSDGVLMAGVAEWQESRGLFNEELRVEGSVAAGRGWQRDYFRGAVRSRLRLRGFRDGV